MDTDDGRMYVGEGQHWITERGPWKSDEELLATVAEAIQAQIAADAASDLSEELSAVSQSSTDFGAAVTLRGDGDPRRAILMKDLGQMRGMNISSAIKSRVRFVQGKKCWWSPPGMSCEDYYASFTLSDGTVIPGKSSADSSTASTSSTNSQADSQHAQEDADPQVQETVPSVPDTQLSAEHQELFRARAMPIRTGSTRVQPEAQSQPKEDSLSSVELQSAGTLDQLPLVPRGPQPQQLPDSMPQRQSDFNALGQPEDETVPETDPQTDVHPGIRHPLHPESLPQLLQDTQARLDPEFQATTQPQFETTDQFNAGQSGRGVHQPTSFADI